MAFLAADYAAFQPHLEETALEPLQVLIPAGGLISHIYFPKSGVISLLADTIEGRIEIGMVGREGMGGLAAALGTDTTPHLHLVQGVGHALRIETEAFRQVMKTRPSMFWLIGLYAQSVMVQIGQTAYANASFTIEARLSRWILMTQDRTQSDELLLTHEFMSDMLGVRRPGVTGAVHLLEGTGAIRASRGRVTVIDREKLEALADDTYGVAEGEYERLMIEARG